MNTAEQLRESAAKHEADREESFQRCDTDGFMSQAAHQIMAQVDRTNADIIENGGRAVFHGLYEGDRRIPARMIEGAYGQSWLIVEESDVAKFGRKFVPIGENSRVQKILGICERQEWDRAKAKCGGWSSVRLIRLGDRDGRDAVLVDEELREAE